MSCPKCKPICKCANNLDDGWRHKEDCPWLKDKISSISVQLYQAETFKEWLRLGMKVFRLPHGYSIPPPWDLEKTPINNLKEGDRHPLYKSYVLYKLAYGNVFQWQWDPKSDYEIAKEQLEADLTEVPRVDKDP